MATSREEIITNHIPDHSETTPLLKSTAADIIIRRATLRDSKAIGILTGNVGYDVPLAEMLYPRRKEIPREKFMRRYVQGARRKMLNPRNLSFVAVAHEGKKEEVIGYTQFIRLGDDFGAKKQIASNGIFWRLVLWVLGWIYGFWCKLLKKIEGADKTADPEAFRAFFATIAKDNKTYWDGKKSRENRWHAQGLAVKPEWQRKGIGRRLMMEVIERAEEEGVIVGLESSFSGERLYKGLGFELLGRFEGKWDFGGGGIMIWKPSGWRESNEDGEGEGL